MSVLVEVPLGGSDEMRVILVEADRSDIPADVVLATPSTGGAAGKATATMVDSLDQLDRLLRLLKEKLDASGPDHVEVQFGVRLGGETGLILAKGTAEVNLTVTMSWTSDSRAD